MATLGWGGVGMMTFLAHVHIFDATGWWRSLRMYTSLMLRDDDVPCRMLRRSWWGGATGWDESVPCTCTHLWCYGMMTFLAHVHIFDATGWWRSLRMYTSLMLRDDDVPCTLKGHYSSKCKRIQVLAATALRRKPGIMSVLNALQLYRNDCSSGKICMAPKDAFVPDCLSWLDWNGTKSFSALWKRSVLHFAWQAWWFAHRRTGIITRIYIYIVFFIYILYIRFIQSAVLKT